MEAFGLCWTLVWALGWFSYFSRFFLALAGGVHGLPGKCTIGLCFIVLHCVFSWWSSISLMHALRSWLWASDNS